MSQEDDDIGRVNGPLFFWAGCEFATSLESQGGFKILYMSMLDDLNNVYNFAIKLEQCKGIVKDILKSMTDHGDEWAERAMEVLPE